MKRLLVVMIALTPAAACQAQPGGQGSPDYVYQREALVRRVGEESRAFIREYGDPAVAALSACSPFVGLKLVKFAATEKWGLICSPPEVLAAVAKGGDAVALWVTTNPEALGDPYSVSVFAESPLEFAHGFKDLPKAVAAKREVALRGEQSPAGFLPPWARDNWQGLLAVVVGVVLLAAWSFWRQRAKASRKASNLEPL